MRGLVFYGEKKQGTGEVVFGWWVKESQGEKRKMIATLIRSLPVAVKMSYLYVTLWLSTASLTHFLIKEDWL